ncbi:ATP-binding protein [Aegicerativicinus sediminis]|uniref:ATP-binding protein n=1 Tax=Aegicerativicinus sediminis TaxID=2893202 RepID=UPI001E3AF834|nr:ATP-binding protein [Aegicerativicinus sediminis]
MRFLRIIILFAVLPSISLGQESRYLDSLEQIIQTTNNDTIKMDTYRNMGFYLQNGQVDSAEYYHQKQLEYAEKLNMKLYEADAYQQIAYVRLWQNDLSTALTNYNKALKIANEPNSADIGWGYQNFSFSESPEEARLSIIGMLHYELSTLYSASRMESRQKEELEKAIEIGEKLKNQKILSLSTRDLATIYENNQQPDSALAYYNQSLKYYNNSPYITGLSGTYQGISRYYLNKREYDSALLFIEKSIKANEASNELIGLSTSYYSKGMLYSILGVNDSTLYYTNKGIDVAEEISNQQNLATGYTLLSNIYKNLEQPESALYNLEKAKTLNDSLNNDYINKLIQMQNIGFEEQLRLKQIADDQIASQNRLKMIGLIVAIVIILFVALFLYRNNQQKQKSNTKLENTLSDLQAAQAQLIQSEKMASLGELTAGIAHEIQNPLNFVNNFSEVSKELMEEIKEELINGNSENAKQLAQDVINNLDKINHHGKRAETIVKGMLLHSRGNKGEKKEVNLNALVDEYIRLAYHGLRAKDKSFNATIETDFDSNIKKFELVPQDIGRVILNLLNNAFYAVHEKQLKMNGAYNPTVSVSTKQIGNKIDIEVGDNGDGIPKNLRDKIFQPFFTTKPTGQGTGLGLSLSYDIIKAHNGSIYIDSEENKGTVFKIELPYSN